jgi:hypothetical protein
MQTNYGVRKLRESEDEKLWVHDLFDEFTTWDESFFGRSKVYIKVLLCHNLSPKFITKAKACKGASQEWARESYFILLGMQECRNPTLKECEDDIHTPEMRTWESSETPENSEFDRRGQNTSPWGAHYTVGKVLKHKCRKWPCMRHSETCNTSYVWKKGWESKWQFDYWSLKVRNRPDSLACRQRATYRWKAFNEGYNFALDLIIIEGLHNKLCTFKVAGVPSVAILGLPSGSLGTKRPFGCGPRGVAQSILYGGRWWLSPSPGRGE